MHMNSFQDLNSLSAYFHKLDSNSVEVYEEDEFLDTENFVVESEGLLESLRDVDLCGSNLINKPEIARNKKRVLSITTDTICSIPTSMDTPRPVQLPLKNENIPLTQELQEPKSPLRPTTPVEVAISDIDVLCVNCYECIRMDAVDHHSEKCCRNISPIPEIEDDTDLRITKLQDAMKERQASIEPDKLEILIKLQEVSYALLENSLSTNLIDKAIESAVTDCLNLPNSHACIVFARRLSILADLKYSELPKDLSFLDDEKLKTYEEEIFRQKQELERWKVRNELLIQLAGLTSPQAITDVASDLEGSECSIVSYNSIHSELTGPQFTEVISR
jgi:hypothetical protein